MQLAERRERRRRERKRRAGGHEDIRSGEREQRLHLARTVVAAPAARRVPAPATAAMGATLSDSDGGHRFRGSASEVRSESRPASQKLRRVGGKDGVFDAPAAREAWGEESPVEACVHEREGR